MIDYACMKRSQKPLRAELTRAINSKDPEKVRKACRNAVNSWNLCGAWPDDWSRWQRALDDSRPWSAPHVDLASLAD